MDGAATSSFKMPNGLRHTQSMDNLSWASGSRRKYWPTVDENCPLHGGRGMCTCASFVNEDKNSVVDDGVENSEPLNQSFDVGQQYNENNEEGEFVSPSIKPFNNNPALPDTQRDIVGNNLHFNPTKQNNQWIDDSNDQLAALLLYRDALRRNLTTAAKAGGGLPRMRHGRIGSQWRHIKQTNTYSGSNLMFIDGTVRVDDSFKYPIPRFGYPPMKRPQHNFSSSYNDSSVTANNVATKSLDTLTWSQSDGLNRYQSGPQRANRFQSNSKESFGYLPSDSMYKNSGSLNHSNLTHNESEARQTIQERVKPGMN